MHILKRAGAVATGAALLVSGVGAISAHAAEVVPQAAPIVAKQAAKKTLKVGLATSAKQVTSGKKVKLTATVKTKAGKAVKGTKVYVQRRSLSAKDWTTISIQRTNSKGKVYRTITNNINYQYRAVAVKSAKNHRAVSPYKTVTAKQWLKVVKDYCTYSEDGHTWDTGCSWDTARKLVFKVSPGLEGQKLKVQNKVCEDVASNGVYVCPKNYTTQQVVKVKLGKVTANWTNGGELAKVYQRIIWPGTKSRAAVSYQEVVPG